MQDQPGASSEQAVPVPQEKTTAGDRAQEIKKAHKEAATIGRRILGINEERVKGRYSFYLNPAKIPPEYTEAVRERGEDDKLTEEDVNAARIGSLAISLESARQIKDRDYITTEGGVSDDSDNLQGLACAISDGLELCNQVAIADPDGFTQVVRHLISLQLGTLPEEVKISAEEMINWAVTNYQEALNRLNKLIGVLRDYESSSPYR